MAQPPLLNHSMLSPRRRAHRRAPDDVASLNPDRIEVAGDAEERPKWVSDDNSLANDGVVDPGKEDVGDRSDGSTKKTGRLIPFLYRRDQSIEQLLDLPSKLHRPAIVHGQSWNDVLPTRLTFKSVSSLLKECRAHDHWILFGRMFRRSLYLVSSIGRVSTVGGSIVSKSEPQKEETKGKRLKLPLMGKTMKSYPNYSNILDAQLGGESFSAMTTAEVKDSDAR
ncbi:hypothetical protein Bca4012_072807 [Brassica carinata]